MRKSTRMALLLIGLLAVPSALVAQDAYKWVDDEGVTHYGQNPPPDVDAVPVGTDEPPEEEVERARERMQETEERLEQSRKERLEAQREADEEAEKRARQQKRCEQLRQALKTLTENRNLLKSDGEGGTARMTEEERQERVAKRRRQIEEECE